LHALEMKELPSCVARYVLWLYPQINYYFGSSGFI